MGFYDMLPGEVRDVLKDEPCGVDLINVMRAYHKMKQTGISDREFAVWLDIQCHAASDRQRPPELRRGALRR